VTVVPDRIGFEEAWRVWRIARDEDGSPRLTSQLGTVWPPREPLRATCNHPRERNGILMLHRAPARKCECGIYAVDSVVRALSTGGTSWASGTSWVHVLGRVALWGRIVRGDKGLRAEFAYPLSLVQGWLGTYFVPIADHEWLLELSEDYGVPLSPLDEDAVRQIVQREGELNDPKFQEAQLARLNPMVRELVLAHRQRRPRPRSIEDEPGSSVLHRMTGIARRRREVKRPEPR
jgi:hypothetical protein